MGKAISLRLCALAFVGVLASASFGDFISLNDGGSQVDIQSTGTGAGNAFNWFVGAVDHLYQEEYFFRTDDNSPFERLTALGSTFVVKPLANFAVFTYAGGGFKVDVSYILSGVSNGADMAETVVVTNTGRQASHFELVEYDDFDLNGTNNGDTAKIMDAHAIMQWDANVAISAEVATAPAANFMEVDRFSQLRDKILFVGGNLDPTNNGGIYSGDATFGFQWAVDIAPGHSFIMSKDKLLAVPEPGTLAAFAGLLAVALRRRKK
jgi:hypothetical protein